LKLVGLAQPGDHREGDGCHRHQQEGWRKIIAASLYRVDGGHWGEAADDTVNEIEPHRDDCGAHPAGRHFTIAAGPAPLNVAINAAKPS